MIIDFHTHTFPDRIAGAAVKELSETAHIVAHLDATNDALIASMEQCGIDLSIVLPVVTSPRQVEKINDTAARVNEAYDAGEDSLEISVTGAGMKKSRLISFGGIHPDYEGYKAELSRMKGNGLKGVKLHPVYQGADIDDIRFLRIMDRAAEVGIIVITHGGLDIGFPGKDNCSPKKIRHVVDELGDFPFVAAHMGGWREWEDVLRYLAETKVYLDTSFSTEEIEPLSDGYWDGQDLSMLCGEDFVSMVRAFGAERILFGTDSPWTDQGRALSYMKQLPLTEEERTAILGGNGMRLLGIL